MEMRPTMPSRDKLAKLDRPTLIRHAEVPYVVWGDEELEVRQ